MADLPGCELGRTGLQVTMLGYGAMELRSALRARDIMPSRSSARRWVGVARMAVRRSRPRRTTLRVSVARSPSRVWKLCTTGSVRPLPGACAAGEGSAFATGQVRCASRAAGSGSSNSLACRRATIRPSARSRQRCGARRGCVRALPTATCSPRWAPRAALRSPRCRCARRASATGWRGFGSWSCRPRGNSPAARWRAASLGWG
jgi:hypothetical protein